MIAVCVGHVLELHRSGEWPGKWRPFAVTWLLLAALFISPLCALSSALFSVRVAHHVALVAVVAPLAILALPTRWRAVPVSGFMLTAILALHTVVVWIWHEPALYAQASSSHAIFWAMQLSLLGTALVLWLAILSPRMPLVSSVTGLLAAMMQMGFLGAIVTFAPRPLYAPHFASTDAFGLSPLDDQQVAGMIMWVPAVLPYLAAALILLAMHVQHGAMAGRSR